MSITPLPKTPNVDDSVSKSLWNWLIKMGVGVNQLVGWVNDYSAPTTVPAHKATHATGGTDALAASDINAAPASHVGAALGTGVHPIPSGSTLQVVNSETGAVATGTTIIPWDDTIPQNTEGTQFLSATISPKSASNTLIIDVVLLVASSVVNVVVGALFQDATANALAAAYNYFAVANSMVPVVFRHKMAAGTTSATTFKVRAGIIAAGTLTLNGQVATRYLGGALASSITITEVSA